MKLIAIVAVDENWAIGKNNNLLYNIPTDMKFFKETTSENIIVYGHNTLKSFPNQKPLPNRINIVLSRNTINNPNIITAHNIDELNKIIKNFENDNKDVYICGGASVYKQLIESCDRALVTKIYAKTINPDAYFPNLDRCKNWKIKEQKEMIKDDSSNLLIQFIEYEKIT